MQHVIEEKSPRVPQNNFGWRLVDFGLKSPQRYIIGIRASKDTHGCRNYTLLLLMAKRLGDHMIVFLERKLFIWSAPGLPKTAWYWVR